MALRQASLAGSKAGSILTRVEDVRHRRRGNRKSKSGPPAIVLRHFHPSPRKEMLPVLGGALAVAALATGLRYLIRAGKRMREMEQQDNKGGGGGNNGGGGGTGGGGEDGAASKGPAFGIDVGVSNLRLAYTDSMEMRPEVVENREGSRWTPACASFKGGVDPVIGNLARAQRFESAATTLLGVQPLLGLAVTDPIARAMGAASGLAGLGGGAIEEGKEGLAGIRTQHGGQVLTAQESLSLMLGSIRELSEHKVKPGGAAVLSCPAYFNEAQRHAMAAAGERAGMNVLDTIDEPAAVVMAAEDIGIPLGDGGKGLVAVLDVGGRTAQCSIVDTSIDGDRPRVVGADWTMDTGGDQWDAAIIDVLDEEFQKANGGLSLKGDPMALTRLFDAATAARVELTRVQQAHVNIPYITADQTGPKHLDVTLTRARVDRIIEPLLKKAEAPCVGALSMAQVDASAVSSVLILGGCCRTPALQDLAAKAFGKAAVSPEQAEELVTIGAALEARYMIYGHE